VTRVRLVLFAAALAGLTLAAVASAASAPISNYIPRGNEETGFMATARPTVYTTVSAWGKWVGKPAAARESEEGFVTAASEQTGYTANTNAGAGTAWVVELGSAADARKDVAAEYSALAVPGGGWKLTKKYSLSALPGSHAWTLAGQGDLAANVIFAEGRCVLLVGDERAGSGALSEVESPIQAGAEAIYKRTHGACP
jgi:hypothetical protein